MVRDTADRTRILHGVEAAALHADGVYLPYFRFVLQLLYDPLEVLTEDVILTWADARADSDAPEHAAVLANANDFIEWLQASSEEESDEDSD